MLTAPRRRLVLAGPEVPALAVIVAIKTVIPAFAVRRLPYWRFEATRLGIIGRARRINSSDTASRRFEPLLVRGGTGIA
jgi:hypothetical protein